MLAIEGRWIWDWWFVVVDGAYHIFYLQAEQSLGQPDPRHLHQCTPKCRR